MLTATMARKLSGFMLSIIFLAASSWAQADGLFDFQMTLAKKGNAEAEFKVGEMYETGFGVDKNINEAQIWINKAAAQGHETANFKLLYWDLEKNGLNDKNKKGVNELSAKANSGNAQAMYYLGKMHAYGVGVKQNFDLSLDWLNKAAFVGVTEAERESILVKAKQQKALDENRKADEARKAKEKTEQEEIKKAEEQRRSDEEKRLKAEAEKKKQDSKSQTVQKKEAEEQNRKKAELARLAEEEAKQEQEAEQQRKLEAQKSKADENKDKDTVKDKGSKDKESKFKTDPCSGKSARFLSTCR